MGNILYFEDQLYKLTAVEIIQSEHERAQEIDASTSAIRDFPEMNPFRIKAIVNKIQTHNRCETS